MHVKKKIKVTIKYLIYPFFFFLFCCLSCKKLINFNSVIKERNFSFELSGSVKKNINDFSNLKDFFLKKNLDKFPVETISEANGESTLSYIPENKKGLYFCHQKV